MCKCMQCSCDTKNYWAFLMISDGRVTTSRLLHPCVASPPLGNQPFCGVQVLPQSSESPPMYRGFCTRSSASRFLSRPRASTSFSSGDLNCRRKGSTSFRKRSAEARQRREGAFVSCQGYAGASKTIKNLFKRQAVGPPCLLQFVCMLRKTHPWGTKAA